MAPHAVYSIDAGLPFADAFAAGLLARAGDAPDALVPTTILLPTRRACRALMLALLRQSSGRPLLLPRMLPIGDVDDDAFAFAEDDTPGGSGDAAIPPAIPPLRRRLLLTRLVRAALGPQASPEQATRLAAELARLLDQFHTERIDGRDLARLVPDELAGHWQKTLAFLQPLTAQWQAVLQDEGCIDPADRRNRVLAALGEAWRKAPPQAPVLAAGTTGSIPAVADLVGIVTRLPAGAIVLPGLDRAIDAAAWRLLSADRGEAHDTLPCSHPQFGLAQLLRRLDVRREDVEPWPAPGIVPTAAGRARLLGRALAPAGVVVPPGNAADDDAAMRGVTLVEAASPEEEARAIALILRAVLEQPAQTAALVTPDRALARRVAAEMRRWGVEVDDSGGQSLARTGPGGFLRLVARMVAERFAPVDLLAALKHPLAAAGQTAGAFRASVRRLERRVLRGLRPAPGLDGIRNALAAVDERAGAGNGAGGGAGERLAPLLDRLDRATQPLTRLEAAGTAIELTSLLDAHIEVAEALAATRGEPGAARLWLGDDGERLARFIDDLRQAAHGFPPLAFRDYADLFDELIAAEVVRPRWGRHPRLAIWGPLEARLQRADVMILGSLNEDSWPPKAHASPWMSRPMMHALGLSLPERRIGLSAHDFCQAFAAPDVWLTRARRKDGAPTVPCRWLLRLKAALHDARWETESAARAARLLHWQSLLDSAETVATLEPPAPQPPVEARPRSLSVTDIETLMRDPYALYARRILKLKSLDPIEAEPGPAEFGTAVHAALNHFITEYPDALSADAVDRLLALGADELGELLERPGVRAFWWPRFTRIARWFVAEEQARRQEVRATVTEVKGTLEMVAPAGAFTLVAKADRIDRLGDGTLAIVDYKTGKAPGPGEVEAGIAPQLPLEGLIAEAGGFADVPEQPVEALEYWTLAGDETGGARKPPSKAPARALIDDARDGMTALIAAFDDPATCYHARPRPRVAPRITDYDRLARVLEWAAGEAGDE